MNCRGPNTVHLCSACRGDCEDPDASLADDSAEAEDEDEGESMSESFPERRERR
jgi:hypothetical protein